MAMDYMWGGFLAKVNFTLAFVSSLECELLKRFQS